MTYVRLLSLVVAEKGALVFSILSVLCIGAGKVFALGKIYDISHTMEGN